MHVAHRALPGRAPRPTSLCPGSLGGEDDRGDDRERCETEERRRRDDRRRRDHPFWCTSLAHFDVDHAEGEKRLRNATRRVSHASTTHAAIVSIETARGKTHLRMSFPVSSCSLSSRWSSRYGCGHDRTSRVPRRAHHAMGSLRDHDRCSSSARDQARRP